MPTLSDVEVANNMLTAGKEVAVLIEHAAKSHNKSKVVYYKAAILILSSMVEASLYLLIKKRCEENPNLINEHLFNKTDKVFKLNSKLIGTEKNLWVAEITQKPFDLEMADFAGMNIFCRKVGIIDAKLLRSLEIVRERRNGVHLQTLQPSSYQRRTLESIAKTLIKVIKLRNK